ncbi:MAG TPA: exodeoxyribonuclease VII large subunit [Candidatus Marinimicrobia bacterium]|nr:exodeoxyribonuclease VII large subunit [Candidatus Neomarinimicrobiota bacterium]HRS52635.1 exodeoxyribonuclease VII large subunit [Candidatus Neomarinimicrobiota bacterium]HRU92097.1 exodeoxyribonuclease VII large subunit [Candidatus Neomarinimicrobiota bacterium]
MAERIYTVTEIARDIKRVIEQFIAPVWVEGEVSNFTISRAGHIYFSLKDQTAVLNCTIWRSQSLSIPFQIVNGMRLLVFGNVTTYAMQSQYQLNVQQVRAAGLGSLYLAFEALKKKLSAEGLFDPERKRPIPLYPTRIGLITSESGAALRDFLQISRRRNSSVGIYLYPALVQGTEAAANIIAGIKLFNRLQNVDFIVITRGGGSLEDLWAFNEEPLVRAVAQSAIPIVSAVGHEVDFTLCDFAADLRAPTPSAAAEMTIPERDHILNRIDQIRNKMAQNIRIRLYNFHKEIENIARRLFLNRPLELLRQRIQRIDELEGRIIKAINTRILSAQIELDNIHKTLEVLNPRAIMERGFAIVYHWPDRKIIKSISEVAVGEQVGVELKDGEFQAKAEAIQSHKN